LDAHGFDRFAEDLCRPFYAKVMGRPSLPPGQYFRLLLVGYFEGIDAERGIAWRAADSLAVRHFVRLALQEAAPDHTTLSRTRRLIDVETHRAVFTWVQQRLVEVGLLKGKTVAIDATTLEANAAMRSIVRRDTEETYQGFLTRLAQASGIATPTREDLARLDRKRKKKTSNKDWTNPVDPDAKVTKMKDGRTHLAHKAEHAVDLETGAIVAVTVQGADEGDTTTNRPVASVPFGPARRPLIDHWFSQLVSGSDLRHELLRDARRHSATSVPSVRCHSIRDWRMGDDQTDNSLWHVATPGQRSRLDRVGIGSDCPLWPPGRLTYDPWSHCCASDHGSVGAVSGPTVAGGEYLRGG
jgi:transposase